MSEATTTNLFRRKLARFFMDGGTSLGLKKFGYMAFGDGGHNTNGTAKTTNPDQTTLQHELIRKSLYSVIQEDTYSSTGKGVLEKPELVGSAISEAGILDIDGNLLGFKNFAPKLKESDETYEISIKLKF